MISIEVDGRAVQVAEGCTIKEALEKAGFEITLFPGEDGDRTVHALSDRRLLGLCP